MIVLLFRKKKDKLKIPTPRECPIWISMKHRNRADCSSELLIQIVSNPLYGAIRTEMQRELVRK